MICIFFKPLPQSKFPFPSLTIKTPNLKFLPLSPSLEVEGRTGGAIKKVVSKSVKIGLTFVVSRVARYLRKGCYAKKLGTGAPICVVVVLEYLTVKVLEFAGNATKGNKKSRIIPWHMWLTVLNDDELGKFLFGVTIASGGVLKNIHSVLLPKKTIEKGDNACSQPKAPNKNV